MCMFENEHRVLVCDIAIHQVREAIGAAFGDAAHFTPAPGQGTRVEVPPAIDEEAFQKVGRTAIGQPHPALCLSQDPHNPGSDPFSASPEPLELQCAPPSDRLPRVLAAEPPPACLY